MGLPGRKITMPAVITAPYVPSSIDDLNAKLDSMKATAGQRLGGATLELAAGTVLVNKTINVPNHVELVGKGTAGTVLQAGPAMTGVMIQNKATNDRRFAVRGLTVWGNARPVTAMSFNTPSVAGQEYADGMYEIEHVDLIDCGSGSLVAIGRGENKFSFIRIRDSGGIAVDAQGVDNHFFNITAGGVDSTGFKVGGANNRFSDCKPYYCGRTDNVNGHGWWIKDALLTTLMNCEAQDCVGHGFKLDGSDHTDLNGVIADSNGSGLNGLVFAGNGIQVHNSDYTMVRARCRDSNRAGQTKQQWGMEVSGWTSTITFDIMANGNQGGNARKTNAVAGMTGRVNGAALTL